MELNKYSKYSKYIDQLSFKYQSCVNLSGESNGFFLSKDVINYCYHAMGEHVAVRGTIALWSEPKSTGN